MQDIYVQIGAIIIFATILAFLARLIRQPLIPAYIIAGIIIGPEILGLVTDLTFVKTISEIGVSFLLFVVGLELSFKKLRSVGAVTTSGAVVQTLSCIVLGYVTGKMLGFADTEAIYFGIIIAFSSTMVVVKLLSDKKELDTLHGNIIIGILLMQDVLAILAISLMNTTTELNFNEALFSLAKAVILILLAYINSAILPVLFKEAARNQELFFLMSLSICFIFSLIAKIFGFSLAIGSFIAGVSLANLPYYFEIMGKIKPLRDFFATIFFVSLGMELTFSHLGSVLIPTVVIISLIVIAKPIIVMLIVALFGYTKRVSFLTAISLAQVSEFSLILIAAASDIGRISEEMTSTVILATFVTIGITSYFIKFDNWIYNKLKPALNIFDIMNNARHLEYVPQEKLEYDALLIGYSKSGYSILKALENSNMSVLVVDFNPDIIRLLIKKKIACIYGDIEDPEIIERINFKQIKYVVSTVPEVKDNLYLLKTIRKYNKSSHVFVTANTIPEALQLYKGSADYVILPHYLCGNHVSIIINRMKSKRHNLFRTKQTHIQELLEWKDVEHLCPTHFHLHR